MKNTTNSIRSQENEFKDFILGAISSVDLSKYNSIELSTDVEDTKYSFDLRVKTDVKVSVRLRTNKFIKKKDITIRTNNCGHRKSEAEKLIEGEGNLYFYGFLNSGQTEIVKWCLFDIDKVRPYIKNTYNNIFVKGIKARFETNGDGSDFMLIPNSILDKTEAILRKSYNWIV